MKELLWFGLGFFVCRWLMESKYKQDYLEKEQDVKNTVQNKLHDILQSVTDYTDEQISGVVLKFTEDENSAPSGDIPVNQP